jgi:hypothetical protein
MNFLQVIRDLQAVDPSADLSFKYDDEKGAVFVTWSYECNSGENSSHMVNISELELLDPQETSTVITSTCVKAKEAIEQDKILN